MEQKIVCPKCGSNMILRSGKYGKFWGCVKYPKCNGIVKYNPVALPQKESPKPETTVKKVFKPSPMQEAIFKTVESFQPGESLVINAVAGSGKTTTIVKACDFIPQNKKALFLAFNKSIAETLKERLPENVKASTFHSLGFSIILKTMGKKVKVDNYKLDTILKQSILTDDFKALFGSIKRLVSLLKGNLLEPTIENLESLSMHHDIELNESKELIFESALKLYQASIEQTTIIDFDDMLFFPVALSLLTDRYDIIIVDESQDTNPLQLELVSRCLNNGGNLIFVGDNKQAIYGFRGADSSAIRNIITRFDAMELPLSVSFRCSQAVGKLVNNRFPDIAFSVPESAIEGNLKTGNVKTFTKELNPSDMVLCRTNAPLVKHCFALISEGKKAIIKGRDIGQNLLSLVNKMKVTDNTVVTLLEKLNEYYSKEYDKLVSSNRDAMAQTLTDKVETIIALTEGIDTINQLSEKIDTIFSDESEGIVFSSIHKAKGLEANNVYILRPDLLPHPMAKQEWMKEQESNLEYVAYTRAIENLTIVEGKE